MNKIDIIILTVLTLIACSKPKTEFEQAFEKYDMIKLPITFNSKRGIDFKGITRDSIGVGGVVYGRLFQTDKVIAAIDLSIPVYQIIPEVTTLDKEGNIIDRLSFFKTVGQEPGWSSVEDYTILPDMTILSVDSTETYEFAPDSLSLKEIPGTKKLTVTTEKYKILDSGKIQKIE